MRIILIPTILATTLLCFAFFQKPYIPSPIQTSYIYGYNNSMIIAAVTNANKDQIAYTSFENGAYGYWIPSGGTVSIGSPSDPGRTGLQYYNLGSLQRNALLSGKYTVSFWATGTVSITGTNYTLNSQSTGTVINGWTYYEKIVTLAANNSNITLSITSGKIDEARLLPFDAVMMTNTYDPLVGKTSETDANNITTYYEYDEFQRLKRIKDQYGNIIKQFVYHYKGQYYDPLGLELAGIERVGSPEHRYKFQGKESITDLSLYWQDFGARYYDAQLGRWHVGDPAGQFGSPYLGMGNRPVMGIDPDGRIFLVPIIIGAAIGAYTGHQIGQAHGAK